MNDFVKKFYQPFSPDSEGGNFHAVISLQDSPDVSWPEISKKVLILPKGWFELSQLNPKDRVEFLRDYWNVKLPYHPSFQKILNRFFEALDGVAVFIIQKKFDDPFDVHMVYSLRENGGFFQGHLPITDKEIEQLQKLFPDEIIPEDYLAFLKIHNGFCKASDSTGILCSGKVFSVQQDLRDIMDTLGLPKTNKGKVVSPDSLIPFYESFGMPYYQCFWKEWYPKQEMGNIYYSAVTNTISFNDDDIRGLESEETLAFPTFSDWLMFYLEPIE